MRGFVVAVGLAVLCVHLPVSAQAPAPAPPVVAVLGERQFNALHAEFGTADGANPTYPAGMPAPTLIDLPDSGTFAERREAATAGPLSALEPGRLYAIAGTRLLVIRPHAGAGDDVLTDPNEPTDAASHEVGLHGTGVMSAAIGLTTGAAPDALGLFVTGGNDDPTTWSWLADQSWIDVVSLSGYTVPYLSGELIDLCEIDAAVRRAVDNGITVFSSSGNTSDQMEMLASPNGFPEVHQVGGVDANGQSWRPPHADQTDPFWIIANVTRPYVTGALYEFETAAHDSLDGRMRFGGTSGATPLTAGYAARLADHARRLLAAGDVPQDGPLADGELTAAEVSRVLSHTAAPFESPSPARYLVEGYGAVNEQTLADAMAVVAGDLAEPARPGEDAMHEQVTAGRAALFSPARCLEAAS